MARANPNVPAAVIAELPEVVQQSTVMIDPEFIPGSPIVYPDGTPVEGQSESATRQAAMAAYLCSGSAWGPPTAAWGPANVCGSAVFGSPGYTRGYRWSGSQGIASPKGCAQGRGFNSSGAATWYGLGVCGQGATYPVPWGNVLANPAVRAKSMSPPVGITINWES